MSITIMGVELHTLVSREGRTGDFIKVIAEKCTGCKLCVRLCPAELYEMKNNEAVLKGDYTEKCMECAFCYNICEPEAIDFTFPKGGTGVIFKYG